MTSGGPAEALPLVGILIAAVTVALTLLIGLLFRRRAPVSSSKGEGIPAKDAEPAQGSKGAAKAKKPIHKHGAEKAVHPHHPLDLNTLKGHADNVTGLAFTTDGRALATACEDGVIRVFKLEDVSAKSFKFLRLSLPPGSSPRGVAFGEGAGQLLVSAVDPKGGCLLMYGPATGKEAEAARAQGKLPQPQVKWEKSRAHDGKEIASIVSASATFGSGDGSTIAATSSLDGTDVRLWHVADGKAVGKVDSNQLQNTMAALSPDGRFLAVAAFTSDVKVWELVYGKDGSVREVTKVMQLKGHKSAVTWLCFCWDSVRIITTSKDGTVKLWNLDVRYHLSEDPKCLSTLPIPEAPEWAKVRPHVLERIAVSPDDSILAATFGHTIQWIDVKTGALLSTAEHAHDGHINWLAWSPKPHRTGSGVANILATCSVDKKVKLWVQPTAAT